MPDETLAEYCETLAERIETGKVLNRFEEGSRFVGLMTELKKRGREGGASDEGELPEEPETGEPEPESAGQVTQLLESPEMQQALEDIGQDLSPQDMRIQAMAYDEAEKQFQNMDTNEIAEQLRTDLKRLSNPELPTERRITVRGHVGAAYDALQERG
jgi:hypothetical protein